MHESVGHPTELDRILGWEANFAGRSFVDPDDVGALQYGSRHVNFTVDNTLDGGVGSWFYDDDGMLHAAFPVIRDGLLVGLSCTRETAPILGWETSNGCCRADRFDRFPINRIPNLYMEPGPDDGVTPDDLIAGVDRGIYIEGQGSFSIDQMRRNFQFGGDLFWLIEGGKKTKPLKKVTYQSQTTEFWGSCDGVAGPAALEGPRHAELRQGRTVAAHAHDARRQLRPLPQHSGGRRQQMRTADEIRTLLESALRRNGRRGRGPLQRRSGASAPASARTRSRRTSGGASRRCASTRLRAAARAAHRPTARRARRPAAAVRAGRGGRPHRARGPGARAAARAAGLRPDVAAATSRTGRADARADRRRRGHGGGGRRERRASPPAGFFEVVADAEAVANTERAVRLQAEHGRELLHHGARPHRQRQGARSPSEPRAARRGRPGRDGRGQRAAGAGPDRGRAGRLHGDLRAAGRARAPRVPVFGMSARDADEGTTVFAATVGTKLVGRQGDDRPRRRRPLAAGAERSATAGSGRTSP